jgi:hypothetical protein
MATFTKDFEISLGNARAQVGRWTASGTAEAVDLGVKILGVQICKQSAATAPNAQANEGVSGTNTIGTLALTGTASGDVYNVVVYTVS